MKTSPHTPVAPRRFLRLGVVILALLLVAVSPVLAQDEPAVGDPTVQISLYTSVTQDTVEAVLAAFAIAAPGLQVDVYRAPTGELDARIAAELRSGGLGADVLWLSDPLSMERYAADGLLATLEGEAFEAVPAEYRTETSVGTRLLNLVIAARPDLDPMPTSWADLADPALAGRVAMPDPGFAGTAYAALGYFATAEDVGIEFYERLKANGAVVLPSPVDVLTGVAEGRYDAGISLDKIVTDAAAQGSPVELVWPEPGAIAVYSPAAVAADSSDPAAAQALVEFLVSPEGQAAIASTGWQPVRSDVVWPEVGRQVAPDWAMLAGQQAELMDAYRAIFGE